MVGLDGKRLMATNIFILLKQSTLNFKGYININNTVDLGYNELSGKKFAIWDPKWNNFVFVINVNS